MGKNEKRNGIILINGIRKLKVKKIKINSVEDYFYVFKKLLQAEDKILQKKEHVWLMGIDEDGYIACVYIVALGRRNAVSISASDIFKIALIKDSQKIILAHNHPIKGKIEYSEDDLAYTSRIYHQGLIVGLELIDHIIISPESLTSEIPVYYSFIKNKLMDIIYQDAAYEPYFRIKNRLDAKEYKHGQEMKQEGREEGEAIGLEKGQLKRNIEIARNLLAMNMSVEMIMQATGLTAVEIEEIKSEM